MNELPIATLAGPRDDGAKVFRSRQASPDEFRSRCRTTQWGSIPNRPALRLTGSAHHVHVGPYDPGPLTVTTPPLTVEFEGETRAVDASVSAGLVFGRGADLDLDSNPFMHRRVGRVVQSDGVWWIENLSAWTPLTVTGGGASVLLPGNARAALLHQSSIIRFEAGSCNYEIRVALAWAHELPVPAESSPDDLTATYRPVSLPLTDEQRLLVVALAEDRLRGAPGRYRLPANAVVATRLGWSSAKFNRKLDYLCSRLDRIGVGGMRAGEKRANDRRLHLVDHMIRCGYITTEDLVLLGGRAPDTNLEGQT